MTSSAFPDDSRQTPEAQKGNRPAQGARQITAAEAFGPNGLLKEPAGDFLGLSDELPRTTLAGASAQPAEPALPEPEPEVVFAPQRSARRDDADPTELVAVGSAVSVRRGLPKWLPLALIGIGVCALGGMAVPYLVSKEPATTSTETPVAAAPKLAVHAPAPQRAGTAAAKLTPAPGSRVASNDQTQATPAVQPVALPAAAAQFADPARTPSSADVASVAFQARADGAVDVQWTDPLCVEPDPACVEPSSAAVFETAPELFSLVGEFDGVAQTPTPAEPIGVPVVTSAAGVAGAPVVVATPVVATTPVDVSTPIPLSGPLVAAAFPAPIATPIAAPAAAPSLDGVTLVWASNEIPHEHIAPAVRLQTPNVGIVKVLTLESEVFVGRLLSVGQGKVWLQIDPLGKLAFDASSIRELSRPEAQTHQTTKDGFAVGSWVRAKTAGGTLYGKLLSADGTQVTLVLENGARISVTGAQLETARAPLSKETPPKTKVQKAHGASKPKPKPKAK